MVSRTRAMLLAMSCLAVVGCAKKGAPDDAYTQHVAERVMTDGLVEQAVDLDNNGVADIRNFYREREDAPRLLVRKELDLNRDGKKDVVTHFDDDGNLVREDMDSDYDGRLDWTDHYKDGVRVMSEYDTDFDGRPNMFKYYMVGEDGTVYLDRKERDEDGDGQIDVWERFSATGEVVRAGRDTDGDGKVDERLD